MNAGKRFENDVKASVPDGVLLHRVSDSANSFGGNDNLRFTIKNPFDYIMWDANNRNLYALELKTVHGKSISFERSKDDKGEIHLHQILGLEKWDEYQGTICGFVIEFRELEKTIFLEVAEFIKLAKCIDKKSFSFSDLDKYSIRYFIIPQTKKITHYRYDIGDLIAKTKHLTQNKN